jgi:DNA-binding CsgD family transcriptional regulator
MRVAERETAKRMAATLDVAEAGKIREPAELGMVRFVVGDQELVVLGFTLPDLQFPAKLSKTEREIARQICKGLSTAAIAGLRRRSPFTIVNQMRSLYAKLGIHSRAELVYRLTPS